MSNERIDLTQIEVNSQLSQEDAQTHVECWADGTLGNNGPLLDFLIAELKRYYGFVDELLTYFHHTILEDESFMDLMHRMGHFERD